MSKRVLADTGPIVAIFSEDDGFHAPCLAALKNLRPPLLTCWPVIAEVAWLLRKRPRSLHQFFGGFDDGLFALLPLAADDLPAIAATMKRYEDIGLQFADASLVHLAERENLHTLFTTDRRDFSIVRLKRNRALRIIPDLS